MIDIGFSFNFVIFNMATRAKYTLVKAPLEDNEPKKDTDILMRFSDRYGTSSFTQASMSPELSLSSSERVRISSPLKLLKSLWTELSGSLKLSAEKLRDFT